MTGRAIRIATQGLGRIRAGILAVGRLVLMRMVAEPGTADYGRLSVMLQYRFVIDWLLDVPPESFDPPPKVDSAVVRLVPHATMPHPVKDVRVLSRITTEAFNQRRKTVRNSLGNLFSVEVLTELGVDPAQRVAIVTSDFHLCRARLMWGGDTAAVPAHLPSALYFQCLTVNYFIREAFGLAAYFVYGG